MNGVGVCVCDNWLRDNLSVFLNKSLNDRKEYLIRLTDKKYLNIHIIIKQ